MTVRATRNGAEDRQKIAPWLQMEDWLQRIAQVGSGLTTEVYYSFDGEQEHGGIFCALLPRALIEESLKDAQWDLAVGSGGPSFSTSYDGAQEREWYSRTSEKGIEHFVIVRDYNGVRPDTIEILEEFRLLLNLYHDVPSGKYLLIKDDGNEEEVVVVGEQRVKVRLSEVRRFLAARDMYLAVFFDIVRFHPGELSDVGVTSVRKQIREKDLCLDLSIYDKDGFPSGVKRSTARLLGKKLIGPSRQGSLSRSRDRKRYEEFLIGVDAEGRELRFTCEAERLANFFGKNPDAPNYLTPVFFRKEVLQKYYGQPDKYDVSDGQVRCASLWHLPIDNNHKSHIAVFLGDLGYLPESEQTYWKSFNVVSDGTISETNFRRSMMAEFADATAPDLKFRAAFLRFQEAWQEKHGWPFFKPLAPGDEHLLSALHVPLSEEQVEFDNQILALTKVTIDSLNEKQLARDLGEIPPDTRGIGKLELFLAHHHCEAFEAHTAFLRQLQNVRSTGVGHRKSEAYEQARTKAGIAGESFRRGFEILLERALALLDYLGQQSESIAAAGSAA